MTNLAISNDSAPHAVTFQRAEFAAALGRIVPVIARKNTLPILSNVRLVSAGGVMAMRGTDLDCEIVARVHSDAPQGFDITLPGHELLKAVKASKATSFTLTLAPRAGENPQAVIDLGGITAKFATLPAKDFPHVRRGNTVARFEVGAGELARALEFVSPAISTEATRYYLNGAFMHHARDILGRSGLAFVATDGARLNFRTVPALFPVDMPPVIIPRGTVATLLKLMGRAPDGAVKVELSKTIHHSVMVRFSFGGLDVQSKTIDGTFPDYARIVPRHNETRATLQSDALGEALKGLLASHPNKGRKGACAVRFGFGRDRLNMSWRFDEASGEASLPGVMVESDDDAPLDYEFEVGFNGKYMADLCDVLPGEVTAYLRNAGSPALFTSPQEPRGFSILMPARV